MIIPHVRRNFNSFAFSLVSLLAVGPVLMLASVGDVRAPRLGRDVGMTSNTEKPSPRSSSERAVALKHQRIYAPHWTTERGSRTELYIRNVHVERPVIARVSLLVSQEKLPLDPLEIGPLQTASLDVGATLSRLGVSESQTGGATIDFQAESATQVSAYAQIVDTQRSLGFDFPFLPRSDSKAGPLEAVTWYYSEDTQGFVALQNTNDGPVSTLTTVFVSGNEMSLGTNELGPNEIAVVKLPALEGMAESNGKRSLGVRVDYSGGPGAVTAQGWAVDEKIGFSVPFTFHEKTNCNCGTDAQSQHGTGIMIAGGGMSGMGLTFSPYLVTRNISGSPLTISPTFSFDHAGKVQSVKLPAIVLAPQRTAIVNLRKFQESGLIPASVEMGDLDLAYRGKPGLVIAELASVDQNGSFVSPVPLTCTGKRDLFMPFWRTDGDWHSSLVLRNLASEENQAEIRISYPGGVYLLEQQIPAGSTAMVSVNDLQRSQLPDRAGNQIPPTATMGGMNIWSRNVDDGLVINPMVINPTTATCGSCPGDGCVTSVWPIESYADYNTASGFQTHYAGDQFSLQLVELWTDGTRASTSVDASSVTSDDGTVASWSSPQVSCLGAGLADIGASTSRAVPIDSVCDTSIDSGSSSLTVAVCAVPTNFRQDGNATNSSGDMIINYTWDSSTGHTSDLSQVTIGERVDYTAHNCGVGQLKFAWPSPPWNLADCVLNPTITNGSGSQGPIIDTHEHRGFRTPYQAATFTSTQIYRYKTPCANSGNWVTLKGPLNIVRTVSQNQNGTWKYQITKDGNTVSIDPLP